VINEALASKYGVLQVWFTRLTLQVFNPKIFLLFKGFSFFEFNSRCPDLIGYFKIMSVHEVNTNSECGQCSDLTINGAIMWIRGNTMIPRYYSKWCNPVGQNKTIGPRYYRK